MAEIQQKPICDGVEFRSIQDARFKTMRIAVNFMLPMTKETAAANALLPFLLSRASREYPDFTKLGERLSELYGADLSADVQKLGDVQMLSICAVGMADQYALEGENISRELSGLLRSVIFDPPLENGLFPQDGFEQEKRQTVELIEAEFNDKRIYAKQRCEQIMCAGEPYGISRFGGKDEVLGLKREELTPAWKNMLEHARAEVMVLGNCDPNPVFEEFRDAFCAVKRGLIADCETSFTEASSEVDCQTEKMSVAQSKLVMGFKTGKASEEETMALRLASAIFGGTPHSKLFLNVREKLSLCYYCSARYNWNKGILLVESGVETQNIDRAVAEILNQLDEVKKGNFDEEEIKAAKLSMCNSFRTVGDYLGAMENWYVTQTFCEKIMTPEQAADAVNAVTKEQIVEAARRIKLDTEYRLVGSGEEAE